MATGKTVTRPSRKTILRATHSSRGGPRRSVELSARPKSKKALKSVLNIIIIKKIIKKKYGKSYNKLMEVNNNMN